MESGVSSTNAPVGASIGVDGFTEVTALDASGARFAFGTREALLRGDTWRHQVVLGEALETRCSIAMDDPVHHLRFDGDRVLITTPVSLEAVHFPSGKTLWKAAFEAAGPALVLKQRGSALVWCASGARTTVSAIDRDGTVQPLGDFEGRVVSQSAFPDEASVLCLVETFDSRRRVHWKLGRLWVDTARLELLELGFEQVMAAAVSDDGTVALLASRASLPAADPAGLELFVGGIAGPWHSRPLAVGHPIVLRVPSVDTALRWSGSALELRVAHRGRIELIRLSADGRQRAMPLGDCTQVVLWAPSLEGFVLSAMGPATSAKVLRVVDSPRALWTSGWDAQFPLARIQCRPLRLQLGEESRDAWSWEVSQAARGTIISLHGGPHGFSGPVFAAGHLYRHLLALRGYRVITFNPLGSGSYGADFAQRIRGQWGRADLAELLALVEQECAGPRPALVGYSYGGYLAAWAATQTQRFCAVASGAPITDFVSFAESSDIGPDYMPWELALDGELESAMPWAPITHAARVQTPLLLQHGTDDVRVPAPQSRQFFERLQAHNSAEKRLVLYPGGTHTLPASGRPSQRVEFHDHIVDWVTPHLDAQSSGALK